MSRIAAATTLGLLTLALSLGTGAAAQSIVVTSLAPENGAIVNDNVSIRARVQSTYEIAEVHAVINDREVILTTADGNLYAGTLSLFGINPGPLTLMLTVTDMIGTSTSVQQTLVLDRFPSATVASPLQRDVVGRMVNVSGVCTDAEGMCTFSVSAPGVPPVTGAGSINATLNLSTYLGRSATITFSVRDERGQVTIVDRLVYVEDSPFWLVLEVVPDLIVDFDPARILYRTGPIQSTGTVDHWSGLSIEDRVTGSTVAIPLPSDRSTREYSRAELTDMGAVFTAQTMVVNNPMHRAYDWNSGVLYDLGPLGSAFSLYSSGRYATWVRTGSSTTMDLRDLVTRTTVPVGSALNNGSRPAPDGRLLYRASGQNYPSYLYSDGASTLFADGFARTPLYDGELTYYVREEGSIAPSIWVYDGSAHHLLADYVTTPGVVGTPDYRVRAGWLAYNRPGATGQTQVWLRNPEGIRRQLSPASGSSVVDDVSPTGDVLFRNNNGRRYLSRPSGDLTDVGSSLGTVEWLEDGWYLTIGRTLFKLDEGALPTDSEPGAPPSIGPMLTSVVPNPVSSHATVTFSLHETTAVDLSVYDVLGRRVATFKEEEYAPGTHSVTWNATGLPSGVYTVVLGAGSLRTTRLLTVAR